MQVFIQNRWPRRFLVVGLLVLLLASYVSRTEKIVRNLWNKRLFGLKLCRWLIRSNSNINTLKLHHCISNFTSFPWSLQGFISFQTSSFLVICVSLHIFIYSETFVPKFPRSSWSLSPTSSRTLKLTLLFNILQVLSVVFFMLLQVCIHALFLFTILTYLG